jgi:hypothetical protein
MAPATGDADQIDAVVLIEPLVLHRHERLPDVLGQRPDRDGRARLASDLTDERPVARVHERRLRLWNDLPHRPGGLRRGRRSLCREGRRKGDRQENGDASEHSAKSIARVR